MRLIDADVCPCNGCPYPFCLRPGKCKNFNQWLMSEPPNLPLMLEELREMDGEPVWVERHSHFYCPPHWALVHVHHNGDVYLTERNCGQILFIIGDKVYCRKPEEGTT